MAARRTSSSRSTRTTSRSTSRSGGTSRTSRSTSRRSTSSRSYNGVPIRTRSKSGSPFLENRPNPPASSKAKPRPTPLWTGKARPVIDNVARRRDPTGSSYEIAHRAVRATSRGKARRS